jgi:exosortase
MAEACVNNFFRCSVEKLFSSGELRGSVATSPRWRLNCSLDLAVNRNISVTTTEIDQQSAGSVVQSAPREWPWRSVLLGSLVILTYRFVIVKLVTDWYNNPDFSHGFLVPVFASYVVWRNRREIQSVPWAPSWWGVPVIVFALLTLIAGTLGAELFLARISLIIVIGGIVITLSGIKRFRTVLFPWALLFLMIPIPAIIFNQITFPLQLLASKAASTILPLLGVPVLREGNVMKLPSMQLEVAEACSGIRSLMSLGTMSVIYGYLLEPGIWRRVILALASIPIAVAANSARVVGTGLCVQFWDPEKALGFFHEFSGWAIFVVSLLLLYLLHSLSAAL